MPLSLLALAVLLQIIALVARSEAWNVCVRAAGGTVNRRVLFRAAAVGYVASVLNGSVGMAARIASLRRSAPQTSPRVPALMAAEVPIITVELALRGDLLLYVDRTARRPLVGAGDCCRGRGWSRRGSASSL